MLRLVPLAVIAAVMTPGCAQILGEYDVAGGDGSGSECSSASDCGSLEGCDQGVCRQRCIDSSDCDAPYVACCGGEYCGDSVGTPCDPGDYNACGGCIGSPCYDRDANAQPTSPYCSRSCSDTEPCPTGYTCKDMDCYRE